MTTREEVQAGAVAAIMRSAEAGEDGALALMATGIGKTRIGLEVARRRGGRALWLVHLNVLADQAARASWEVLGHYPDVEAGTDEDARQTPLLVASVQSLARRRRLARFRGDEFRTVVCDEAHHSISEQWSEVLGRFAGAFRVGLTATGRADGAGLGAWFSRLAYAYPLAQATRDGVLVPTRRVEVVVLGSQFLRARREGEQGEETERKLLADPAWRGVSGWAVPLRTLTGRRKVLTFAPSVRLAEMLAERVRAPGVGDDGSAVAGEPALAVHGGLTREEVRARLSAFRRGEVRHLVACQAVGEGYDEPSVGAVGMCAPTSSPEVYQQRVGRGSRPHPGKEDCLVVDFVGAGRHGLVTALDVLGPDGGAAPEDRRAAARAEAGADPGADVLTCWERAERRLSAARAAESAEDRRARDEEARARVRSRVRYLAVDPDRDPLALLGVSRHAVEARRRRGARPSDRVADALRRAGVPVPRDPAEAAAALQAVAERRRTGLCTYRQAAWLCRLGLPSEVTFRQASALLGAARRSGGSRPQEAVVLAVLEECGGLEDDL